MSAPLLEPIARRLRIALGELERGTQEALDEDKPSLAAQLAEAKASVRLALSAVQDAAELLAGEPTAELDSTRIESRGSISPS